MLAPNVVRKHWASSRRHVGLRTSLTFCGGRQAYGRRARSKADHIVLPQQPRLPTDPLALGFSGCRTDFASHGRNPVVGGELLHRRTQADKDRDLMCENCVLAQDGA